MSWSFSRNKIKFAADFLLGNTWFMNIFFSTTSYFPFPPYLFFHRLIFFSTSLYFIFHLIFFPHHVFFTTSFFFLHRLTFSFLLTFSTSLASTGTTSTLQIGTFDFGLAIFKTDKKQIYQHQWVLHIDIGRKNEHKRNFIEI